MNCRVIDTSGKLDVRQVAWTSFFNWNCLIAFEKNTFLRYQKRPLPFMPHGDMDWRIKLKVFKEMVDEFRYRLETIREK